MDVAMETVAASLFLLLTMVATSTSDGVVLCDFSEFLQTPGKWERWIYNLSEAGALSRDTRMHYIHVHQGLMSAQTDGALRYKRSCTRNMGNDTFLVTYEAQGEEQLQYSCMHFIRRSRAVVTVIKSEQSDTEDPSLCSKLVKDDRPWVMVDAKYYEDCPVLGGFNMQLFDGQDKKKCFALFETPRLEAGCSDERTSTIDFNFQRCNLSHVVYEMKGENWQTRYCTGSWNDGPYTFVILTSKDVASYWCLRFPTEHGDSFDAYLFSDVVCETNALIREANQWARLALSRHVVTSACDDSTPACQDSAISRMCSNSVGKTYCRQNCSSCEISTNYKCDTFNGVNGTWRPLFQESVANFTLGESSVVIHPLGSLQCSENKSPFKSKATNLVKYASNGCFPRLYCLKVQPVSPYLSVFQVLRGPVWPEYTSISMTCSDNAYELENRKFKYFINSWTPAVSLEHTSPVSVDCGIRDFGYTFSAEFADKSSCTGRLYKPNCENPRNDTIIITYEACTNQTNTGEHRYTCLGELPFNEEYGRYLLVQEDTGKYQCFYFNQDMYYLKILPGDKCFGTAKYLYLQASLLLSREEGNSCNVTSYLETASPAGGVSLAEEMSFSEMTHASKKEKDSKEQTFGHVASIQTRCLGCIALVFICLMQALL